MTTGPTADLIDTDDVPGESGGAVTSPPTRGFRRRGNHRRALYTEGIDEADHDRMTESRQEERATRLTKSERERVCTASRSLRNGVSAESRAQPIWW